MITVDRIFQQNMMNDEWWMMNDNIYKLRIYEEYIEFDRNIKCLTGSL